MRRAVSPIIATAIVVIVGGTVAALLLVSDLVEPSAPAIYKLAFTNIYQVKPVSIANAGWQLALLVENTGNRESVLENIYVNGNPVEELGYIHGESLPDGKTIATSIPVDGLAISPGASVNVYIWIGGDLFSQGTELIIELQKQDQLTLRKTIVLR